MTQTKSETPGAARWSLADVAALYRMPLLDLVFRAAQVHRAHHDPREVQLCTLLSIKTGGCQEDCAYCPQSSRYETFVAHDRMMTTDSVLAAARAAREAGSTRFCMGAAWRDVPNGKAFDRVVEMVQGVRDLGLEACCTLGMLNREQAERLAEAGLTAYNHNLDTSADYYGEIITTRTYQERLDTIQTVSDAGIKVCSGGIIGLGESETDRIKLLHTLSELRPQPESVPINALVPVEGTPLADRPPVEPFSWIRAIAVARILLPRSMVRLSAGRLSMSPEAQAMAFLAGANSIFTGDRLLTTPNPEWSADTVLFETLGLRGRLPGAEVSDHGCHHCTAEASGAVPGAPAAGAPLSHA